MTDSFVKMRTIALEVPAWGVLSVLEELMMGNFADHPVIALTVLALALVLIVRFALEIHSQNNGALVIFWDRNLYYAPACATPHSLNLPPLRNVNQIAIALIQTIA